MKLNQNEPKIFSIWELSNALEMKPSEFFKLVEDKLPENFTLLDL